MSVEARQESQTWQFTVGIEAGTLTAIYDPKYAEEWLQRLFTDLHQFSFEQVLDHAAKRGLTRRQAGEELRKKQNEDAQKCVAHALIIMREQMRTAIDDALRLYVTEEIPLQVLRDLNGQTSLGNMRLPRFKGKPCPKKATADKFGGDGSIAAAMEGVAQQHYDLAKERMGSVKRGEHAGSREYNEKDRFLSDLRDAIKKPLKRGCRVTQTEVADELMLSTKTFRRRLDKFHINFRAEVKQQKMDTRSH
ncbi:MAG TPA: hypothetical protein VJ842_02955 [Pyrinomonadaceae bacterium]|nr:hypothetical protein [Pyrinomonadaceae bacterium]